LKARLLRWPSPMPLSQWRRVEARQKARPGCSSSSRSTAVAGAAGRGRLRPMPTGTNIFAITGRGRGSNAAPSPHPIAAPKAKRSTLRKSGSFHFALAAALSWGSSREARSKTARRSWAVAACTIPVSLLPDRPRACGGRRRPRRTCSPVPPLGPSTSHARSGRAVRDATPS
jgi:hypothetical protein